MRSSVWIHHAQKKCGIDTLKHGKKSANRDPTFEENAYPDLGNILCKILW